MKFPPLAALVLAAITTLQGESPADRAKIEPSAGRVKVSLDGMVLYDGPGSKAVVGTAKGKGLTFVTVAIDGVESVRVWARETEPLKAPDPKVCEADALSLRTSTDGDVVTVYLVPTINGKLGAPATIYEGDAVTTPTIVTNKGILEVTLDGVVIFRAPRKKPDAGPAKAYAVDDFVERLNRHRRAAGVAEVKGHAGLSKACDLHALYLAKNIRRPEASGLNAHKELKELPGWTEEGAAAAPNCVIHIFGAKRDLMVAVDALMATLYHRFEMIDPRLAETGVGWAYDADGVAVVVIHVGGKKGTAPADPVAYPGDGQKEVPVEFGLGGRETPDPVPDPKASAGYPVTLQWPEKGWLPVGAKMTLTCEGREVAAWVSTPEKPARSDWPTPDRVSLIPKEKLAAGKSYTVEFSCTRSDDKKAWSKRWSFTTSK
jgi:hypothetical protein